MKLFLPGRRPKLGVVFMAIHERALAEVGVKAVVEDAYPVLWKAAEEQGGRPVGAPEVMTSAELEKRGGDAAKAAREFPGCVWIVAQMIPIPEREPVLEIVAPPVIHPRAKRRRHRLLGR